MHREKMAERYSPVEMDDKKGFNVVEENKEKNGTTACTTEHGRFVLPAETNHQGGNIADRTSSRKAKSQTSKVHDRRHGPVVTQQLKAHPCNTQVTNDQLKADPGNTPVTDDQPKAHPGNTLVVDEVQLSETEEMTVTLGEKIVSQVTDPTEKEIIPQNILDLIDKNNFNKDVIKYVLGNLEKKLQHAGIKMHVRSVEAPCGEVTISMISYWDTLQDELKHDPLKTKFLCWILTGNNGPLTCYQAHCRLVTNIGCDKSNHIFLLDSSRSENYELTGDVLNALGHLLQPELNSTVTVQLLKVPQQTYDQPLCFPYTFGFAIEILKDGGERLGKIKFDEEQINEDLKMNLWSKDKLVEFKVNADHDPDLSSKDIVFQVKTSLTDPLPPHWEQRIGGDGGNYFLNRDNGQIRNDDPRDNSAYRCSLKYPLPAGWEMRYDEQRIFFVNHETESRTWDDPRNCPQNNVVAEEESFDTHQIQKLCPSALTLEDLSKFSNSSRVIPGTDEPSASGLPLPSAPQFLMDAKPSAEPPEYLVHPAPSEPPLAEFLMDAKPSAEPPEYLGHPAPSAPPLAENFSEDFQGTASKCTGSVLFDDEDFDDHELFGENSTKEAKQMDKLHVMEHEKAEEGVGCVTDTRTVTQHQLKEPDRDGGEKSDISESISTLALGNNSPDMIPVSTRKEVSSRMLPDPDPCH